MARQPIHPDTIRNGIIIALGLLLAVLLVMWYDQISREAAEDQPIDPFAPQRSSPALPR